VTARSIFQKICPGCMNTLALDARACACGHEFDHDDTDASLSSEEIRVKAEELYENYLAARAEQAASTVMSAQAEYARDPSNSQKSNRVAEAIRESEEARAALSEQSARVREMRMALPQVTAPAPPKPVAVAPAKQISRARPAPAPVRPRVTARPAMAVTVLPRVAPAPSKKFAQTPSKPVMRITGSAQVEKTTPPVSAPATPEEILPPVQSKRPGTAFRQAQAYRADKILRAAKKAESSKPQVKKDFPPVAKEKTRTLPIAPVLSKSAPRLLASNRKECPNCTSSVEQRINRCRCGYEFPTSESLIPALNISEEERAEFAKLFSFP